MTPAAQRILAKVRELNAAMEERAKLEVALQRSEEFCRWRSLYERVMKLEGELEVLITSAQLADGGGRSGGRMVKVPTRVRR